jgi:integrase
MAKQFTWGEAYDYTFRTKWKDSKSERTNSINAGHFTRYCGRSFPVKRIDQIQMDLWKAWFKEDRLEARGKLPKIATCNRVITAVATVINTCAKRKMCDPAPIFEKGDEGEGRMFWYTKEEVERISLAAIDPFYRQEISDITLVAAFTGMRQGELLRLRARDVDFSINRIHVGGIPDQETKAKNYRAIPIHDRILKVMRDRLEHLTPSTRVFDDVGDKDQLLDAFKRVRDYANAPAYTFHDLRHSFGTWHAQAGTSMRTLMGLMGHRRIETTLRYAKHTGKAADDAMALI